MENVNGFDKWVGQLNAPSVEERLAALEALFNCVQEGKLPVPKKGKDVNNHIHTTYSFSPYSPSKAVWMAYNAGLSTAGIIDHDSVSGTREFIRAGEMIGLPVTIGAELRISLAGTALANYHTNCPDQSGIAYITFHGIPHTEIDAVTRFLAPVYEARGCRNRKMVIRLNEILSPLDIYVDYNKDILPLAQTGGSVTERHLLYAVSLKLLDKYRNPENLLSILSDSFHIMIPDKIKKFLLDEQNPFRDYDLLGLLKSDLLGKVYIPATDECLSINQVSAFTKKHGIILAYPYLGDITTSVTGDKKAQTFEDSYLPELFDTIQETSFDAVTYMPSRNTREQLIRLRELCDSYGFFQISGEDINQPRQAFVCEAMRDPFFANLYDAAWALIGHERIASKNLEDGMFSEKTIAQMPSLEERINYFQKAARET